MLWPLPGGHRNQVFLVERDGTRFVAKTTRHSEAGMQWLLPVLAKAEQAGLRPPQLLKDVEGRLAPGGMTLETYIEGRAATWRDMNLLWPRLRRLHGGLRHMPPRPGQGGVGRGLPIAHVAALKRALRAVPPARISVVHGDATPSNTLIVQNELSLIDWDEARVDHPAFDTPIALQSQAEARLRFRHEVVAGWRVEPSYARGLARRLRGFRGRAG